MVKIGNFFSPSVFIGGLIGFEKINPKERGYSMNVQEMLVANKRRQARACELNQRAGQGLFKVFGLAELVQFVAERLNGARRQAEITQPEGLLLPELDQAEVARVERENPLQIELCGQSFQVDYQSGSQPRVSLGGEITPEGLWQKLPDSGVFLPGGRQVFISLGYYYSGMSDTDIPRLKEKVRNYLNQRQWDAWANGAKPEIVLPDSKDESSEVAPTVEATYGKCAVTGALLAAFGTAVVNGSHYYSTDPHFVGKWFQSRSEAEDVRAQSVEKLSALKRELAEKKVIAEAKAQAEEALRSQPKRPQGRPPVSVKQEEVRNTPKPSNQPKERENFGLGKDAWGALDGLKF